MRGLGLIGVLIAGAAWADAADGGTPKSLFGCEKKDAESPSVLPVFNQENDRKEPEAYYLPGADERQEPKNPSLEDDDRPDYLNGLSAVGRCWEITSDTAFGTRRVLTERLEVARALKFSGKSLSIVIRAGVGLDGSTATGLYAVQGLIASLGFRHQQESSEFSIEAGIRVIPGYGGPEDSLPEMNLLALNATYTSGIGNDAAWLPVSSTGGQIYLDLTSRTGLWVIPTWWIFPSATLLFGTHYGGAVSIGTLEVRTWLGPQSAFVGNVFLEGYVGMPTFDGKPLRLQAGIHLDASLSSIWPGKQVFPMVGNGFVGWSPTPWLALRVFAGIGGSPGSLAPSALQYGLRVQFYLP